MAHLISPLRAPVGSRPLASQQLTSIPNAAP